MEFHPQRPGAGRAGPGNMASISLSVYFAAHASPEFVWPLGLWCARIVTFSIRYRSAITLTATRNSTLPQLVDKRCRRADIFIDIFGIF